MKVVFIRSANNGIDPISTNQGKSLINEGINVEYFDIIGKGLIGYISNIGRLRDFIRQIKPDILHAHFSLSGFIVPLTLTKIPVGVSLMGSDVNNTGLFLKFIIKLYTRILWSFTIVKSEEMYDKLNYPFAKIIPNGVDLDSFYPIDTKEAKEKLGWDLNLKHIIFASNPNRPEKNYSLAKKALDLLEKEEEMFRLHYLQNINPKDMMLYYNAADVLLMTSFYEGSPNVIKEAMACNCPIVSTEVGDVKTVLNKTRNTYITSFSELEIKQKLKKVLSRNERTDGRLNISQLDSKLIAKKISSIYSSLLEHD